MRGGLFILAIGIGLAAGVVATPQDMRQSMAENSPIPEHVYYEAERQFDMFVAWARSDEQKPQLEDEEAPL